MNKKIVVILTFSEEVCQALREDLSALGEYTTELMSGLVSFTIDGERHEKEMKDIVCACKNKSLEGLFDDMQPLYFTAKAHESYCQESCLARGCPCFTTIDIYIKLDGYEPFCLKDAACVCEFGADPVSDEELTFRQEGDLPLLEGPKNPEDKKGKRKKKERKKSDNEGEDPPIEL